MINITRYLDYIIDNKLTQEQFMFLYLLYYQDINSKEVIRLVRKYKKYIGVDALIGDSPKQDLIDRGYVVVKDSNGTFTSYQLTKKFSTEFVDEWEAIIQLMGEYPPFLKDEKTGQTFPLKGTEPTLLKKSYANAIMRDIDEHHEVLKDTIFARNNGLIRIKLETYVKTMGWLDIRKIRLKTTKIDTAPAQSTNNDF